MERNNGKTLLLKIILVIIIIGVIALIIMNIIKGVKQNSNKEEANAGEQQAQEEGEENAVEEFVQQTDDGTKVNVGSKLSENKEVEGLSFTNIQLTEKDNQSTLLADVENKTGKDIDDYTNLNITFLTKDGQEIITIKGILPPLKSGASTQLNAGLTQDVANAYDVEIKINND